jgi:hypothetical protein
MLTSRPWAQQMSGNHLFDLNKEHFHIHTTFAVLSPQGQKIMEVKSSFARAHFPPKPATMWADTIATHSPRLQSYGHLYHPTHQQGRDSEDEG